MLSKSLKVLLLGLGLIMSNAVFGQSSEVQVKQQNPDRSEFIANELKLDDQKTSDFNKYFDVYTEALKAIRLDKTIDREAKATKYQKAKDAYYHSLKTILSKDQFLKYLSVFDASKKPEREDRQ